MKRLKEYRNMKVYEISGYRYKPTPMIVLKGQWLQELGFSIGNPVMVKCEDGKLIITLDAARAELIEEEKTFMERETKKLHKKFLKEKKELPAESEVEKMALKQRITINVTDPHGKTGTVLKGADARLPARLARFPFGDFTQVYLLKPGQSVESVDVKEVKEGGSGNG